MDIDSIADWLGGARILDLGHPMVEGMPQSPNHPQFRMVLERRHGDRHRPGGDSAANEIIVTGGHVGTHIDALSHYSHAGCLHGGVDAAEAQTGGRFKVHGAETLPPIVGRAVLLDVPAALGKDVLDGGEPITADDIDVALRRQASRISPGDVVLIRTGWGRRWNDPVAFLDWRNGMPGPDVAAIEHILTHRPAAVGSDTLAFEHLRPGRGLSELPGHRKLLVEHGVPIMEMLALEEAAAAGIHTFLFFLSPLKLVGATGSPVRPLAILPPDAARPA